MKKVLLGVLLGFLLPKMAETYVSDRYWNHWNDCGGHWKVRAVCADDRMGLSGELVNYLTLSLQREMDGKQWELRLFYLPERFKNERK